jgi:hypothetical protein
MRTRVCGWTLGLAVVGFPGAVRPEGVVIEIEAGPHHRHATPVVFPRPAGLEQAGTLRLEDIETTGTLPAQVIGGERPQVAVVIDDLAPGARHRYRLTPAGTANRTAGVTARDDGKGLTLLVANRPVLTYNHAVIEPPKGIDPLYRRSGFIHPLVTPAGRIVTDDFPVDHAHQHGLFFAWVNTTFAGHKVDFWNQPMRTGRVRHLELDGVETGPVVGQFKARLRHEDITGGAIPVPVLDETWTVRVYDVGDRYLVDLESSQTCAGARPLEMAKYLYGGLGFRGAGAWFDPKAQGEEPPDPSRSGESDFLTSEGKGRATGNHTRPRWVDLFGKLDGEFAGLAVLDHPSNFRFPQPVRLHPNKPYLSVSAPVLDSFRIEPGKPYVSRYRFVIHDGRPDPAALDGLWRDYAEPPVVRVVE